MSDLNYYNLLKSADTSRYFSYLNDTYMKLVGPKIKVFKLDKQATVLDDVYGSEKNSRIFLPPFDINAIYLTNPWTSQLGLEPYQEVETALKIAINFENMVATLRDLKNRHTCDILIEYSSTGVPAISKVNGYINLYVGSTIVKAINLSSIRTTNSLLSQINNTSGFSATLSGVNDESSKILDFNKTEFLGSQMNISVIDDTFKNITEVIEMGDIVLTEKWRAYEVENAAPGGDFGWSYTVYVMDGKLIELDMLDGLPGDYRAEIEKHQYGMRKVSKE